MIDTAVILAAGIGSRMSMSPAFRGVPKPLVQVAGVPIIVRVVRSAVEAGIRRFVVVTGHRAEDVRATVAASQRPGVEIAFAHNPAYATESVGASVLAARSLISGPFALLMADHVFEPRVLRDLVAAPLGESECILAVDYRIDRVFDLSDAKKVIERDGYLVEIGRDLDRFDAVDTGLFACTSALFDALETVRKSGDIMSGAGTVDDALRVLAAERRMRTFDIGDGYWQDVDTPEMLAEAERLVSRHDSSVSSEPVAQR